MAKAILVSHRYIGANDELGAKLYLNFWRTMAETTHRPTVVAFVHDAVNSLLPDSPVLEPLQLLARDGVELIACRTCCDYYGIAGKLAAGVIVGMGDIENRLFGNDVITI